MHSNSDGYATGSKDGTVILWDNDFKPITKLDMINSPVGYEGNHKKTFECIHLYVIYSEDGLVVQKISENLQYTGIYISYCPGN